MQAALFPWCILAVLWSAGPLWAGVQVVPTPQYLETLQHSVAISNGGTVDIVLGPGQAATRPKMKLAAEFLRQALSEAPGPLQVRFVERQTSRPAIYLWDFSADPAPPVPLNLLDRRTLSDPSHWRQGYIIRTPTARSLWAVGSSDQAVLLATMTILQMIRQNSSGVELPGVYVRDYPDFEYRAAADWLLNGEVNRWSMDRGQGLEAYRSLCKRKLDQALRYKVNMALIDGFGWGLRQRFSGYSELMRDLNRYARARGIRLVFGGYGASYGIAYQTGPIYEEGGYLGEVFKNREWYPDGPAYQCMGFTRGKKGVDASILGSCRANEELNRLKAEELRTFVESVEPGALYIHNEDCGSVRCSAQIWQKRCPRCRKRWPSDDVIARDGGAGGLANGYSALIRAVNSVNDPASGYDGERDCEIILVSPVYHPDASESEDWSRALELWKNIGEALPRSGNVQICFREVFPQKYGCEKWTDKFNHTMQTAGLNFGLFLYFAGGADDWVSDYPTTGAPAMNALFRGAKTIYNGTGDFYREPMEIVNAEYSWNVHSTGFFADPPRDPEGHDTWRRYMFQEGQPPEIFNKGGLFSRACALLYGLQAGSIMSSYYMESAFLPDVELTGADTSAGYLPMTWNRVYALPSHWRHLAVDSKTWGPDIRNERYSEVMTRMKIDRRELHRRLVRRWTLAAEMNRKGAAQVNAALAAGPRKESTEDLRFLERSFRVCQPLTEALKEYHTGLAAHFGNPRDEAKAQRQLSAALVSARQAQAAAVEACPQPLDPIGGDIGAVRKFAEMLARSIEGMQKNY